MSKTYKIKNLKTTPTNLRDGSTLESMYVCNTTATNQTFTMLLDDSYVYKDVVIPPYVSLVLEGVIYYSTNEISITSGNADSIDVIYTLK